MAILSELQEICPDGVEAWRKWLKKHHTRADGVWLVFFKKSSGRQGLSYSMAVEEALCWGWIDSKVQPLDEERYRQVFTPRKAGSVWSALNKRRVAAMVDEGRMQAAGLAKIDAARRDGSWTLLDAVESLELPPDLLKAFQGDPQAAAAFEALAQSRRKMVLHWLMTAKREATRQARIAEIVRELLGGRLPGPLAAVKRVSPAAPTLRGRQPR